MKISVICKTNEWQVQQLEAEARLLGVDLEVRDITTVDEVQQLGEVVIWRSSTLGSSPQRKVIMDEIMKSSRFLMNRCLAIYPEGTDKFFQQRHILGNTDTVSTIDSYIFKDKEELLAEIKNGNLRFPFIEKPRKGSKGEGVELVSNESEIDRILDVQGKVYQNFIKNSGDFRIFVLGGKVLGVIKRIAQEGSFLNNISKGGRAEIVTDPQVLKKLHHIGTTVASIFSLTLCGVDVVYDENSETYRFLEVNTVPQWKGFQGETGVNVAKEIITYCQDLIGRKNETDLAKLVRDYYMNNIPYLWDKKFHFFSRLYLWTRKKEHREMLDKLRNEYLGENSKQLAAMLEKILDRPAPRGEKMVARDARIKYFEKYPALDGYLGILFKNLFARSIYGEDIRQEIAKHVSEEQLLKLKDDLENDRQALKVLSTHAINYLYLLREYLGDDNCKIDIEVLYQIGRTFSEKEDPRQWIDLCIYFYTHCIIGASGFYSHIVSPAEREVYVKMLGFIDDLIVVSSDKISLDNKFEFLVCAKICNYKARTEAMIMEEAEKSISAEGNFIIDMTNSKAALDARNSFAGSEHRNVLFLMSRSVWEVKF